MLTLLEFGTIWFYVFLSIMFIAISIAVESENNSDFTPSLLATAAVVGLYFLGNKVEFASIFSWLANNPIKIIGYFILYLVVGTIWSFLKWFWYLKKLKKKLIKKDSDLAYHKSDFLASNNKARITNWMIWWPFSVIWFSINDPIVNSVKWIFDRLENTYQSISDRVLGDEFKETK